MNPARTNPAPTRVAATLGAATLLTLLAAGTASAHVTADSPDATRGGYAVVTLRVPTESDTAGTVGVTVELPTDTPLASVRTEPMPGWTAEVVRDPSTDDPTSVTWTADPGTQVGPDQFAEFRLSVGPLPETDTLVLPTTQTYSDGEVVGWVEPPAEDGSEPELPAPVVVLAAAGAGSDDHGSGTATADVATASAESSAGTAATGTDDTARWLGGGGLVVGALGLGVGAGAVLRSRRVQP